VPASTPTFRRMLHGAGSMLNWRSRWAEELGQVLMPSVLGPSPCGAVVRQVADGGVRTRVEENAGDLGVPVLGGEMEGGDAAAVVGAAERGLPVGIRAQLEQPPDRGCPALRGGPDEGSPPVGV